MGKDKKVLLGKVAREAAAAPYGQALGAHFEARAAATGGHSLGRANAVSHLRATSLSTMMRGMATLQDEHQPVGTVGLPSVSTGDAPAASALVVPELQSVEPRVDLRNPPVTQRMPSHRHGQLFSGASIAPLDAPDDDAVVPSDAAAQMRQQGPR